MSARRTPVSRAAWAVSAALLLAPVAAGCSSTDDGGGPASSASTSSAGASSAAATAATAQDGGADGTAAAPSPGNAPSGDDAEPTAVATDPPVDTSGSGSSDLEVVVSYAAVEPGGGAIEVSGFVPGVVEDGGRCVLVLRRTGRDDVRVEGEALADAQSTSCALLSVPVDRLAPGEWTARLDYRSDTSAGSSAPQTVDVP